MFGRKHIQIGLLMGLVGGFFAMTYLLMQFRFSSGDVYPAYSTLRSDPVGAKGLYQSLEGLQDLRVKRHFLRWNKLAEEPATVFILGLNPTLDYPGHYEKLDTLKPLLDRGSRVVLGFTPKLSRHFFEDYLSDHDTEQPDPVLPDETPEQPDGTVVVDPSPGRLGYELELLGPEFQGENEINLSAERMEGESLPEELAWHSIYYFHNLAPEWRVIYAIGEAPVVVERSVGSGSLVVFSDCYHLSNQALWEAAEPQFLSWLVGPHRSIIFDETHFGIQAETNVMGLIRQFRLEGVLFGGILLALLYIWQQTSSLVPPLNRELAEKQNPKNVAAGLINLLNRGLERSTLLATCVRAWEATLKNHQKHLRPREAEVRSALEQSAAGPKSKENLVSRYNTLQNMVTRRNPSS